MDSDKHMFFCSSCQYLLYMHNQVMISLFYYFCRYKFEPQDIYNTDESGLTTVQDPKGIIAARGKKQVGSIAAQERGELVTYVGTISASGNAIPPLFIFPRAKYNASWILNGPPGCVGCAGKSGSGWMTVEVFSKVYLPHFVKHAKSSIDHPVMLILDNHESHVSIDSLNFAKANGIHMLTLPPHCSHKLQPLDKTVYGPLKTYYNRSMDSFIRSHVGKGVNIYDIPTIANGAHQQAMTISNIVSGFRSAGIYPFNRYTFSDSEFAAAEVSERPNPSSCATLAPHSESSESCLSEPKSILSSPAAPSTSGLSAGAQNHVSPQEILPCPSYVRKTNTIRRKKRKSAIVTDTPEKMAIELEKSMQHSTGKQKPRPKARRKMLSISSSSNSEAEPELSDHSSDNIIEEDIIEQTQEEFIPLEKRELVVGTFVLVEYQTKRSQYYYAAQIEGIDEDEYQIDCLRIGNTNRFRKPEKKDVDYVEFERITRILLPTNEGLSKRATGCYTFDVDESNIAIC